MSDAANENARPGDEAGRALGTTNSGAKTMGADFGVNDAEARRVRMPSFDDASLRPFLDAGLALIPLHHWNALDRRGRQAGKAPRDGAWQARRYDAGSVLSDAVRRGHNLGVRLTPDVLVVDVDPRNYREGEDSFARLAADFGISLDDYPHVRTGGGGLHVYMRKPHDAMVLDSLDDYPGVEFKSGGRQVVAPGSIHPGGGEYVGVNLELLVLEPTAPASLVERIRRAARLPKAGGDAGELTVSQVQGALDSIEPERFRDHDAWLQLMMAAHHASGGEAREEFIAWSTGDSMYAADDWCIGRRWDSLHSDRETSITARTFYKLVQDAGGEVPNVPADEDFDVVEVEESDVDRRSEERWPFLTREQVRAMPPPRWLVEGFVQETTLAAIYGAPESGKSFLAIDFVMSVATGLPWQGRATTQGAVLYVAAEGALSLNNRFQAWEVEHGVQDVPLYLMCSSLNLSSPKEADAFCKAMAKLGPLRMIVVDTLNQTSAGADENSAMDMGRYIDAMKRMRDVSGAAVVVVHHSGKDTSKGMRGSTALLAGVDTAVEVVRPDKDAPAIHIKVQKQKDAEKEKPIHFEMAKQGESMVLRMTKGSVRQSESQFVASTLLDWVAAWMEGRGSAPFKDLIQARREHLGKGSEGSVRDDLKKHLGEGFDNAKPCSDGTRIWLEREAGNPRGALAVHAVRAGDD